MTEWTDPMTAGGQEIGRTEVDPDAGGPPVGAPGGDTGVADGEGGSTAFGEEEMGGPGKSDEA